jgi:hypothetical protein
MVRYWLRTRDAGWWWRGATNAAGATATGVVTAVVIWTKFAEGAWIVIVAIPLLVLGFYGVRRHYRRIGRRLRAGTSAVRAAGIPRNQVLIAVEQADVAAEGALWYARQIADGRVRAVAVPGGPTDPAIFPRWFNLADGSPRVELLRDRDGRVEAVLEELWQLPRGEDNFVTVVVPERFRRPSLLAAITRPTFRLKLRLVSEPNVVVTDVPALTEQRLPQGHTPRRLAVRILVSGVHAATMRAVNYAGALGIDDTRAVFFAFDADESHRLRREWVSAGVEIPLEISEAQYRDLGDPLLAYLRTLTADPGTVVNIVMPELVLRGHARLLHNQRALYVKRLLLFEPQVILSSVPYQLFR